MTIIINYQAQTAGWYDSGDYKKWQTHSYTDMHMVTVELWEVVQYGVVEAFCRTITTLIVATVLNCLILKVFDVYLI